MRPNRFTHRSETNRFRPQGVRYWDRIGPLVPAYYGVNFDGKGLLLNSAHTATNEQAGTISFWFRPKIANAIFPIFSGHGTLVPTNLRFDVTRLTTDKVLFQLSNSSGTSLAQLRSSETKTGEWTHIMIGYAVGGAFGNHGQMFVNGSSDLDFAALASGTPDLSGTAAFRIGGRDYAGASVSGVNSTNEAVGDIAELYVNTNWWIDFSTIPNRRLFISSDGRPVPLGINGVNPTASQPAFYHSGVLTEFSKNKGYAGDFSPSFTDESGNTTTGSLSRSSLLTVV